ncbi:3-chlorobenzoate-3,4-dioxygenase reductase subunit [Polyplosphaeria fusca]|uniref:3-chlorobenzoate-3,4-dioxygenase reductase subunit n=1 Tax=Polyplosphaeria fusca TaxID=682080 RepID=A0A9P4V2R9_9PLEO|nr:3-chlorobenzoate-3,4-dioxygenase reductase subunit [Polyplosphaeria fusca]
MAIVEPYAQHSTADDLKNPPPFPPHPLTQVRSGRVKKVFNLLDSAIFKVPHYEKTPISELGVVGDEQAFHDHGGVDKALLHYSAPLYARWKQELPSSAHLFNVGGFGENLVSDAVDERTVCIGDKISIGDILVEVTEPRAPCFKLNHRFEVKDMAKRAQTLFRTGWFYRILRTGSIRPGDMITLIERPHPEWTVARIQYYLYIEKDNKEAMQEAVELPQLGPPTKRIFTKRIDQGKVEDMEGRISGGDEAAMKTWGEYKVVEKRRETKSVTAFVLEAVETPSEILPVESGSHVRMKLGGKLVRAYSVVGGTSKRFEIGVALDKDSRGGSKYLHDNASVGDVLTVGRITSSFPLSKDADRHFIIAGGIGITAFIEALRYLEDKQQQYELHFAVADEVPFEERIAALGVKGKIYRKSKGERLNLNNILSRADDNTHVYCCGPQRLMDGVDAAAKVFGLSKDSIHFEAFQVETGGDPFTAELRESKRTVEIGGSQSLLDALKAVGMDIDSSCEVGNCGTCKVDVCSGRVLHRGTALTESEKGKTMLSCVSRGIGTIVLDL